jgi:hypothetical protein
MKQLLITIAAVVLVGCGEPSSELLQQSVTDGNVEAVKQHLADGADVNVKDEARGLTPLHFATQNGQKEIVELLIADGADVNAKMNNGMTPLDCSTTAEQQQNRDGRPPSQTRRRGERRIRSSYQGVRGEFKQEVERLKLTFGG